VELASWIQGDFLRVLLVTTNEALGDEVRDALTGRAGEHRLYWVSQAGLAPGRAEDLIPHIILLDDEALDARAGDLVAELVERVPDAGVILLIQPGAMGIARQAVLAGARGFVSKPIEPDDLVGAMRQVLSRRAPIAGAEAGETIGSVVVFCAPKGGTGRTTLAINTSISIIQVSKQPTVLVDADYAAPAVDVALNLRDGRDISELRSKMSRLDRDLVASVLTKHESGLSVLLAPPPADMTEPFTLPQVQQVLVWLKRMFPWVIVDLGLPLDETAYAFLDSADLICMSVLPEMVGLRNARLMFDQLVERGYPEDRIWLILNRRGLPGGIGPAIIEEWLGRKIRYAIPNDQALATETINRGVPFVLGHRRSAVTKACMGLASQLNRTLSAEGGAVAEEAVEAGAAVAPSPGHRRRLLRPVLAGLIGAVLVLLLAWRVLPSMLSRQQSPDIAAATPTPATLAAAATGSPASQIEISLTGSPTDAGTEKVTVASTPIDGKDGSSPRSELAVRETAVFAAAAEVNSPSPTPAPTATATRLPTATATATPAPTSTAAPSPTATGTATAPPTSTATPVPTVTPRPSPSPTRPTPTRRATRVAPTASPTVVGVGASGLLEPNAGEVRSGTVTFRWQPGGPLAPGTAYEVVAWYPGEDPSAARGMAAPTTESSLAISLDGLYNFGQLKAGDFYWTVLIVRTNPYTRLTQPAVSTARLLTYQPPSEPGATPRPPIR
jgi:pilus assembly protein CpaE